MSRKPMTVSRLAADIGVDADDILIMLWDSGLAYPAGPNSIIRAQDIPKARRSCGAQDPKELVRVDYWLKKNAVSRQEFTVQLAALGVHLGPAARTLPKGALAKLRPNAIEHTPLHDQKRQEVVRPATKVFAWRRVGHIREIRLLTSGEVIDIHFALERDFAGSVDPVSPAGVRDSNLLESAVQRPTTSLGGQRKYETVEMAGAALMHSLVHNHAFFNGNKRTGLVALLSFLDRNGLVILSTQDELFKWTVRVAQHRNVSGEWVGDRSDIEVVAMAEWIEQNSRLLDKGEKVVTWQFLRRRLIALGCELNSTGTRGGRFEISRAVEVKERGFLGATKLVSQIKHCQVAYGGDGREIGKGDLKHLRHELFLDDEHGIDSAMFYGTDAVPPDQFISDYRKTLVRLARM